MSLINRKPNYKRTSDHKKSTIKKSRGRSMVEMLGVLAIIGVLSVGGLMGYSVGMRRYKTNKLLNNLNLIFVNALNTFENETDFSGVLTADPVSNRAKFEALGISEPGANPFGVYAFRINDTYPFMFTVQVRDIPKQVCIELVRADWPRSIVAVDVDAVNPGYAPGKHVTVDQAHDLCDKPSNVVQLWYSKLSKYE